MAIKLTLENNWNEILSSATENLKFTVVNTSEDVLELKV